MAECKHENEWLIGTGEGITCRRCGAKFKTFAELTGSNPPAEEKPQEKAPEKPKRTRKKSAE